MPDNFNPFDIGAWLTPTPEQARVESIQLQKEQTKYLRRIAESRDSAPSPVTYEFAQAVSSFTDGFASLGYGMDRAAEVVENLRIDVQKGFAGLGALFDWRMASVISLMEQQQTTYYEIRDLLRYPRKTAAHEDKEDARQAMRVAFNSEDAARRQWLERALNYLRAAVEKNPFDYTVHLDMGTLLLESYGQPDRALPCFAEAARTAQTTGDREYESKAHFFAGRAHGVLGKHEEAYKETRRALDLQPDAPVITYEYARVCALTGRTQACEQHIETLLRADAIGGKVSQTEAEAWWVKVQANSDFNVARDSLNKLFNRLTAEARAKTEEALKEARTKAEESLERGKKAVATAKNMGQFTADRVGINESEYSAPRLKEIIKAIVDDPTLNETMWMQQFGERFKQAETSLGRAEQLVRDAVTTQAVR